MPTSNTGTDYFVESEHYYQVTNALQDTLRFMSLGFNRMPFEESLTPIQTHYEWWKKNRRTGIGYEAEVVSPPIAEGTLERIEKNVPVLFSNYPFGYDDWRRVQQSRYGLQDRLMDQMADLATRSDLITYLGDSKNGINSYEADATEITTPLNITTTVLAASTFGKALKQLRTAGKYGGLVSPQSVVNIECTPEIYSQLLETKSTNEDFTALEAVQRQLNTVFPNGRIYENYMLGGSYTVNDAGVHTITEGTDTVAIYVSNPMVQKIVDSPLELRQSNLDQTTGIVWQPVKRHTRITVESALMLIETDVTTA